MTFNSNLKRIITKAIDEAGFKELKSNTRTSNSICIGWKICWSIHIQELVNRALLRTSNFK